MGYTLKANISVFYSKENTARNVAIYSNTSTIFKTCANFFSFFIMGHQIKLTVYVKSCFIECKISSICYRGVQHFLP